MTTLPPLKVRLAHPEAQVPSKAHPGDAGFDLYAVRDTILEPKSTTEVDFGIAVEIPYNYVGKLCGRSSYNRKGLIVRLGIIDAGYRGTLSAVVYNTTNYTEKITKGSKCAQLLLVPIADIHEVEVVETLSESSRGTGGFGSTGK